MCTELLYISSCPGGAVNPLSIANLIYLPAGAGSKVLSLTRVVMIFCFVSQRRARTRAQAALPAYARATHGATTTAHRLGDFPARFMHSHSHKARQDADRASDAAPDLFGHTFSLMFSSSHKMFVVLSLL